MLLGLTFQPVLLMNEFLYRTYLQKPISFSILKINPFLVIGIKYKLFKSDEEIDFSSNKRLFSYMIDLFGFNVILRNYNESQ